MNTIILISLLTGILFLWAGMSDKVKNRSIELVVTQYIQEGKPIVSSKIHANANEFFGGLIKISLILLLIGMSCLSYKLIG